MTQQVIDKVKCVAVVAYVPMALLTMSTVMIVTKDDLYRGITCGVILTSTLTLLKMAR